MKIKTIKIGARIIGPGYPTYIVAEAGVNHNSNLELALKLVDAAVKAGADAIKWQTFKAEEVATESAQMADYQKQNLGKEQSQLDMIRALELKEEWYPEILKRCEQKHITFLSAPHGGISSANLLRKLKVPAYKIGSADITNFPLLDHVARFKKPMLLSTGMSTMSEIKEALSCIYKTGNKEVLIFQCTTNYPCPLEEVNLRAMKTIEQNFKTLVGLSEHTLSTDVASLAVAMGASMIEKHLTLDKTMEGPDHKASLEPDEFAEMVRKIRETETILGSSIKKPTDGEKRIAQEVRKSVVALKAIKKGEAFSSKNLGIKRPGKGLHPKFYFTLVAGKKAKSDIASGTFITTKHYGS